MKQYTFRVTQPLRGYYEAELKIQASSKKAKKLLEEIEKIIAKKIGKSLVDKNTKETKIIKYGITLQVHHVVQINIF